MAHAKPNYAPPTMPTFCNDWLTSRSVAALPVAGEALFMRLLLAQWQSGALPDDIDQIMAFVGYRKEFREAWPEVRKLFVLTPDGLINERLEEIRAQWESRSETKRAAAKARWDAEKMQKPYKTDADGGAKPMPSVSVSVSDSVSSSDSDSKDPPTPRGGRSPVDQVIEEWNQMAGRAGLPKTRGHETVRRKIAVQLKDSTWLQAFRDSLAFIEFDDWARGKNDRGWKADIEFILRPGNAHRYAEKKPGCARRAGALPEEF